MSRIRRRTCRRRSGARIVGRHLCLAGAIYLTLPLIACEGLLEVELPGSFVEEDLNDPRLAQTLVDGAQADFDCGLASHIQMMGLWVADFYTSTTLRGFWPHDARLSDVADFPQYEDCDSTYPGTWLMWQTARFQALKSGEVLEGFADEDVPDKQVLLARARAYEGYATLFLGETFCEVFFDVGPRETRADAWNRARALFTDALQLAGQGSGGEASSIRNMALVGRARASLNLGDDQGVLQDAGAVDEGFVRNAGYSNVSSRRRNRIFENNNRDLIITVTERYQNLEVAGVPDPRVRVFFEGLGLGPDNTSENWSQLKYPSLSTPIPFATWREAQLMIAEVEGGQTAVGIINQLRTTVNDLPWVDNDHPGLPEFNSNDPAEIRDQLVEERRRELWLQGHRLGDMLRLSLPFPTGITPRGNQIDDANTCMPVQYPEQVGNQNAR